MEADANNAAEFAGRWLKLFSDLRQFFGWVAPAAHVISQSSSALGAYNRCCGHGSNLNSSFRLSFKFYRVVSSAVARSTIPERSEVRRLQDLHGLAEIQARKPVGGPAIAEMSRPVTARTALSIFGAACRGRSDFILSRRFQI
jgi:hypothetical protein